MGWVNGLGLTEPLANLGLSRLPPIDVRAACLPSVRLSLLFLLCSAGRQARAI